MQCFPITNSYTVSFKILLPNANMLRMLFFFKIGLNYIKDGMFVKYTLCYTVLESLNFNYEQNNS